MRNLTALLLLLCLTAVGRAEESFLALYLQGQKIGYASYRTSRDPSEGKGVVRADSRTEMGVGMLGSEMKIRIDSVSWLNADGSPKRMQFRMDSAGRVQTLRARFEADSVRLTIVNAGQTTEKRLPRPKDAPIADDPMALLMRDGLKPGSRQKFYILDPTTASFVVNEAIVHGKRPVNVRGTAREATLVEVTDPRANTKVFLDAKGEVVKVEAPMGIEMYPVTRAEALATDPGYRPSVDLAVATSLKPETPLNNPESLTRLKLRITGRDLSRVPTDAHQTVTGAGEVWTLDVHPLQLGAQASRTIDEARNEKPEWTRPSLHIPSDNPEMKALARRVAGSEANVKNAALAIRRFLFREMRANAGIGVLRDATEVWKSKEGVCRDYAILTATLTRALGIPTRLASGLVNWDGTFYYHAWVEVWDGSRWLGIDATAREDQISAAHVKLAEGNVDEAFTFTFLDRVKVEVLETQHRSR